ncbi:MAG: glycosyltransferase family 4 protein [Paracoccus sp. (in: a-proteobacteria)]
MRAEPALILDISRLVSRIGTGPLTGIDRVEAAWLDYVSTREHLLLCRIPRAQALLPAEAGPLIMGWINGETHGLPARPGWRERLSRKRGLPAKALSALRAMALAVTPADGRGLRHEITRRLPDGPIAYLNVGHSNLDPRPLANLTGLTRMVLIHDTIPLDFPEYTRAGQSEKFRDRLIAALSHAEIIATISEATAADVSGWRARLNLPSRARIVPAHIGTVLTTPDEAAIPADLDLGRPFFVTLGTIEPRKNHAVLLDAWDRLARDLPPAEVPGLLIIGRRGWENHEVFARLDKLPPSGPVRECAGLSDGAVAALTARSHGLLMPSRAEGFGLPLTEAAGRGVAVVSAPLPAARELLGEYAYYLSPDSPEDWARTVTQLAIEPASDMKPLAISSWDRHFEKIARAIASAGTGDIQ